jgi:hypothetical protein
MDTLSSDLSALLPDKLEGWTIEGTDKIYGPDDLYEYIDGGAELYLSYDFNKVMNRIYTAPDQPDILVDIFDMGSSRNAYGVFSHARETEDSTFGQGSQYTSGLLLFWKDRFFISIMTIPETDASRKAVTRIGEYIDQAIPNKGPVPEILHLLPTESLDRGSIRYFYHYIWLNSFYYIADKNILRIDKDTDAVLAKYGNIGERHLLLLVKYQDNKEAESAYDDFIKAYLPELSHQPAVRIEDGTWTACRLFDKYIVVVFNASEKSKATSLIASVETKINEGE